MLESERQEVCGPRYQHHADRRAYRSGHSESSLVLGVRRVGLDPKLERILSTTNLIGQVRDMSRRVKRWRGGAMILRWGAAGLLEAERHFRRVKGCDHMPGLLTALRRHDQQLDPGSSDQVAA